MKAILLAGGQGRRLRSITGKLPKPMVPLVGVPVLDRLLELLRRSGFTDVCATLCYRPDAIQEHCGDGSSYGVHLRYRAARHGGRCARVQRLLRPGRFSRHQRRRGVQL